MWSQKFQQAWPGLQPGYRSEGGHPVSSEKFRQISEMIVRLARIDSNDIVFDLGCSIGALTYNISLHCRQIIGVDFLQDSIDFAQANSAAHNTGYLCADVMDYQIAQPADCIILNNLIHCVDSCALARRLMRNCFAALKPGGRLYLGEVPDLHKISRSNLPLRRKLAFRVHRWLPGPCFPLLGFLTRRPLDRILLYSRERIARILRCSPQSIATHDHPSLLLNPIDRSHFIVQKS